MAAGQFDEKEQEQLEGQSSQEAFDLQKSLENAGFT